jgi:hypothetical protein
MLGSSRGIMVYGLAIEKETTTTVVLGHKVRIGA